MTGRCLCGEVAFEFEDPAAELEICHCSRCRRVTGSAFNAELRVPRAKFRWLRGEDRIACFDAPILRDPPPYRASFCRTCGSPLPSVFGDNPSVAIPAGLVEGDVPARAARHIWFAQRLSWLDLRALAALPTLDGDPP